MLNKYWNISGWYIFDLLDKYCHEIAIKWLWECVTQSAEIKYLYTMSKNQLYKDKLIDELINCKILRLTNSSIILNIKYWLYVDANFTFIKKE